MGALFAIQIISWVCRILIYILIARSVLSWIVYSGNQYNSKLHKAYNVLGQITEPLVSPVRNLMARFIRPGPMDFAPIVTFFIIIIVQRILTGIILTISSGV